MCDAAWEWGHNCPWVHSSILLADSIFFVHTEFVPLFFVHYMLMECLSEFLCLYTELTFPYCGLFSLLNSSMLNNLSSLIYSPTSLLYVVLENQVFCPHACIPLKWYWEFSWSVKYFSFKSKQEQDINTFGIYVCYILLIIYSISSWQHPFWLNGTRKSKLLCILIPSVYTWHILSLTISDMHVVFRSIIWANMLIHVVMFDV